MLLDEIEKAHPDVFNILLQVLDDGILTDGLGRRVDFKNTILIMTSNIGSRDLRGGGGIGFGTPSGDDKYKTMKNTIEDAIKRVFNPEFLNRIDDTIVFHNLERQHIYKIIDIQLRELVKRLDTINITLKLTKQAREFLVDKGYDPNLGARPLRRALQKYIEDPLAEEILKNKFSGQTTIDVKLNKKTELLRFVNVTRTKSPGDTVTPEEEQRADVT